MIPVVKVWLFETKINDPYIFYKTDGVGVEMSDERTISLLDIDVVNYELSIVTESTLSWSSRYGGEDKGVLTALGKQENEYTLEINLPLYSGRIIDEITGRSYSILVEKTNGQRLVCLGNFKAESFKIENEHKAKLVLNTGRTSSQIFNVQSINIGLIKDRIDSSTVCANIDDMGRMYYDFFPTQVIPDNFRVIVAYLDSVTFQWDVATGANGYEFRWGTSVDNLTNVVTINDPNQTTYTVSGLNNGDTIFAKVKSKGQFVDSLFSRTIEATIAAIEPPNNYVTGNYTANSFDASWMAVEDADSYVLLWGLEDIDLTNEVPVSGTSTTITGLPNDSTIYSRVVAVVEDQRSEPSSLSSGDTELLELVLTIQSDNSGSSSNQFRFPQAEDTAAILTFRIDEEPDNTTTINTGSQSALITFNGGAGTYTVRITSTEQNIEPIFNGGGDCLKILDIGKFGGCIIGEGSFKGCSSMTSISATDTPVLTSNISQAFRGCSSLVSITNSNEWDLSPVTNIDLLFEGCNIFNSSLSNWDVSNVTTSRFTFRYCYDFNQPIGDWNTSSITNMRGMFDTANLFNQDIGNWDVSNVTDMNQMFARCTDFNQDIGEWSVSNVTDMEYMFVDCRAFNQNLNGWDTASCTSMQFMFSGCNSYNSPMDSWSVGSCTDMNSMFRGCVSFNNNLEEWDVVNVTDMSNMFDGCVNFDGHVSNWETDNVINMAFVFRDCLAFSQDIKFWDIRSATNMDGMLDNTGITSAVYNGILNRWSSTTPQNNVTFGADGLIPDTSSGGINGIAARNVLINDYGWTIDDGIS